MEKSIYAVITGDIVNSTKVDKKYYDQLLDTLKNAFSRINDQYAQDDTPISFGIFRGDSFQGVIPNPEVALSASLIIRSFLRKSQPKKISYNWDARTAIGIGTIDYLPAKVSEGTGEAFKYSGTHLDRMQTEQRLSIVTPWKEINDEMKSQTALLDAIIAKWSPLQAEVVLELLEGKSRKEIGKKFDISQAAIHYRVKGAGWFAIKKFLHRFENILKNKL